MAALRELQTFLHLFLSELAFGFTDAPFNRFQRSVNFAKLSVNFAKRSLVNSRAGPI